MCTLHQKASLIFEKFLELSSVNLKLVTEGEITLTLPLIPVSFLFPFLKEMKTIFTKESTLLELDGSFVIVGDLHGHILDLFRIFKIFQSPQNFRYLFLGDFVDRGEFSFETIIFIFLLKYLYPTSVYILRGNHEFESVCSEYGFLNDVQSLYPNSNIFELFIAIFDYLPLAAILQQNIFCIHGGICPEFVSVDQIKSIRKPLHDFDDPLIEGLFWSDPSDKIQNFQASHRGSGCLFGQKQVETFLQQNSFTMIIRAHQCIKFGVQHMFQNQLITVFSASNYCGKVLNNSGALLLRENGKIEKYSFLYYKFVNRNIVQFHAQILISKTISSFHNVFEKTNSKKPCVIYPKQGKVTLSKRQTYQNLMVFQSE
jgi:protein phosphatase